MERKGSNNIIQNNKSKIVFSEYYIFIGEWVNGLKHGHGNTYYGAWNKIENKIRFVKTWVGIWKKGKHWNTNDVSWRQNFIDGKYYLK